MSASLASLSAQESDDAAEPESSIATSLPFRGDPAGVRRALKRAGIAYDFVYTNDLLANVRGGQRRGLADSGKLKGTVTVDFETLAGLPGLTLQANAFQLHNTGRTRRDLVGGINTISEIEAVPTTRLSELWLEQSLAGGLFNIRAGQLAADTEFFFAGISGLFLQSDWPTITAANLPSGGPAYPLSTPGVRLKVEPHRDLSILIAAYNGDPAGPGAGDEQIRNRNGVNFRTQDPALLMGEVQWRTHQGARDTGLARMVKLGGWAHLGRFGDQRIADDGSLLADPAGSGEPRLRRGTSGVYGVFEQQIYRPVGGDAESGITLFARASVAPSDRNPIDVFIDGGFVANGLSASRPHDKFGLSVIYARFSNGLRDFERDLVGFGVPTVARDFEANFELTYQAQIIPGWTVQPMVTYVLHPNGDQSRNAIVTGARSIWRY